jgi:outer membrane protein
MKKRIFFFGILVLILVNVNAQNKIGYVNNTKLFAAMPEVEQANKTLTDMRENMAQSYSDREKMLLEGWVKYCKDSVKFTVAENQKKKNEFDNQYAQVYNESQNIGNVVAQKKEELLKPIREKITKTLQDFAKQNGYAHIIYEENVLLINKDDDVTEKIITKLTTK